MAPGISGRAGCVGFGRVNDSSRAASLRRCDWAEADCHNDASKTVNTTASVQTTNLGDLFIFSRSYLFQRDFESSFTQPL